MESERMASDDDGWAGIARKANRHAVKVPYPATMLAAVVFMILSFSASAGVAASSAFGAAVLLWMASQALVANLRARSCPSWTLRLTNVLGFYAFGVAVTVVLATVFFVLGGMAFGRISFGGG